MVINLIKCGLGDQTQVDVFDKQWQAVVTKGDRKLTADYIRINLKTEDAFAAGNVVLRGTFSAN